VNGEPRDITGFLYEIGLLKRYPRTGWSLAGVPVPESMAEHSFRTSVIASVIATMEGADPQRTAFLALWHDTQETRTTDLPHLTKRYVTAAANQTVTSDQIQSLPECIATMIRGAVTEYEAGETPEARCARDADKLECLLQAREYQDQGHRNLQPWIDSSIASLHTATAKQLADEALTQNSLDWLQQARHAAPSDSDQPWPSFAEIDEPRVMKTGGFRLSVHIVIQHCSFDETLRYHYRHGDIYPWAS
jgi:putative hydrolase of HD superfamily